MNVEQRHLAFVHQRSWGSSFRLHPSSLAGTEPQLQSGRKVPAMSHDTPVSAPKFPVPPGACDTHMHIYEPGYALREGAPHSGQPGTLKHYLEIKKKLGLTRTVIVQPSGYGTD